MTLFEQMIGRNERVQSATGPRPWRRFPFESATGHFDPLPERGIPATAMRGCDLKFWKRTQRAMPRHNWRHLVGIGLTEGGAIVFLAVPR